MGPRSVCSRFFLFLFATVALGRAQSSVPTLNQPIGTQALAVGGSTVSFDLRTVFTLPGVAGPVVQFDTVKGKFNAELLTADAPLTVANFLNYVERGAYTNDIIHRSVPGFVVQGGGFTLSGNSIVPVATDSPVMNEFKNPNVRGTLAMAKLGTGPNTATSQWFVNLADNRSNLDSQNGGFTVFARVLGNGMAVADAIAAVPRYDASAQFGSAFGELPLLQPSLSAESLVLVRTATPTPIFPERNDSRAVLAFTAASNDATIASVAISGSGMAVTPRAAGTTSITVRATDTNGSTVENTFVVSVSAGPAFTVQPASQAVAAGSTVVLNAAATGATSYQWQRNGMDIPGATLPNLTIANFQPANAGVYVAVAGNGSVTMPSQPAVVGIASTNKIVGDAIEFASDIPHPLNGNIYDQVLLKGTAATIRPDAAQGQIVRMSYIDLNDDIVQVEFGGAGNLTLTLENASAAPALPVNYNQGIEYMKGHASIVITGADASTNLTVFSVGRGTAVNQALFRDDVKYDGMADVASVAISLAPGANSIGGVRTANTRYTSGHGLTGIYAPGVQITNAFFIGDISASDTATPTITATGSNDARLTGGDLLQANARPVQIGALSQLEITAGEDSHSRPQPPQPIQGRLERNGTDVTDQVIVPAN